MGSFANALFKFMLGWLQGAVSAVWSAFTSENGTSFLLWIGRNWILVAGVLCVTGLLADLCVYLFRWKPYKVWKSFFNSRKGDKEELEPEEETPVSERPEQTEKQYEPRRKPVYQSPGREARVRPEEPDLSYWKEEPAVTEPSESDADTEPATVTKSGYIVPANSPYRRPSQTDEIKPAADPEPVSPPEEKPTGSSVTPIRHRRIRVSELFSNPDEEIHEFDAPQHVIDVRRAYREPVYPRGWKKDEDEDE